MQYIHKNESKHSEMGQWDKTQSRELLGLFICVCIALCTIVAHNIAQNKHDSFPSYPLDNHHSSDDVYLRKGGLRWAHWTLYEMGVQIPPPPTGGAVLRRPTARFSCMWNVRPWHWNFPTCCWPTFWLVGHRSSWVSHYIFPMKNPSMWYGLSSEFFDHLFY